MLKKQFFIPDLVDVNSTIPGRHKIHVRSNTDKKHKFLIRNCDLAIDS